MHFTLAWIYWNPPRELFTVPYIDRPIAIYGLCFVAGFIIGYFIMVRILRDKFLGLPYLAERDIASWPKLMDHFQKAWNDPGSPLSPLVQQIDRKTRKELLSLQKNQEPTAAQKNEVLAVLNAAMQEHKNLFTRKKLESLFPEALHTAGELGYRLTDKVTWYVVLGTIIGSRLGHVLFYDWPRYRSHPEEIIMVWKGGLASHGGTLGVLIGLCFYCWNIRKKFPEITLIKLLDIMVVPTGLVACLIRVGNFFNQEILGPPTTVPWAIIFGDPADGGPILPRHPTQLYEAVVYFAIFILLMFLWFSRSDRMRTGYFSGLFFILVFTSRFLIDFIKTPQSLMIDESFIQMGQILSLPFIALGLCLYFYGKKMDRCFG